MKKIITFIIFILIGSTHVQAATPKISVESVNCKPTLKVAISNSSIALVSASAYGEDLYDLCLVHSQSYPEGLFPSKASLQNWMEERLIRRQNLSPYHLYKIIANGETVGFIDFGQMPVEGYKKDKFPEIVEKWQSLEVVSPVLDDEGKSQAIPSQGLGTIFPIFPAGNSKFGLKRQAEVIKLSLEFLRAIGPYFSLDCSNLPVAKKLPSDWEVRIDALQKKIAGAKLELSKEVLFSKAADPLFQNEPGRYPIHIMGLFHPNDPTLDAFKETGEFLFDEKKGYDGFHDSPRIMVHAPIMRKS